MHMINKIFNSLEKLASFKQQENQAIGEMEKVAVTFLSSLAKGLSKARNAAVLKGRADYLKKFGLTIDGSGKWVTMPGTKLSDKLAAQQKALLDAQRIGIADSAKWSDEMKALHSEYLKAGRDAKQAFMDKSGLTTRKYQVGVDKNGKPVYDRSIISNGKAKLSDKQKALRDQYKRQLEDNKALSDELRKLNAKGSSKITAEKINDIVTKYKLNPSTFKGKWDKLMIGDDMVKLTRGYMPKPRLQSPKPKPEPKPIPPEPTPPAPTPPTPIPPPTPTPPPAPTPPTPPTPKPPTPPEPGPTPAPPGPKPPSPTPDVPPGGGTGTNIITNADNRISQTLNSTSNQIFNGGNSYINKGTMINGNGNAIGSTIGSGNFTGPAPITKPVTPPKPTPKTPEPKKAVEPELPGQYGPTSPAPASAPVGPDLLGNNWWKYGLTGAGGFLLGRATD